MPHFHPCRSPYNLEPLETRRLLSIMAAPTIRLPDSPGVSDGIVNATSYGVDLADNANDDTIPLRNAIRAAVDTGDNRILYLPAGTYNVNNTLFWKKTNGDWTSYFRIIGEHRDTTVIKLRDNTFTSAPSYASSDFRPNAVFYTAAVNGVNSGFDPVTGSANSAFQNSIWNLTIDIGSGNTGAVGIDYHVTNQGSIKDVKLVSSDATRRGFAGIRMTRGILGPGLLKNVEVSGFDYGIFFQGMQAAMTLEHINLQDQRVYGVWAKGSHLSARDISSNNTVPAINMQVDDASTTLAGATLSLIDSNLLGGLPSNNAIIAGQRSVLHVRNTITQGYGKSVLNAAGGVAGTGTVYDSPPSTGMDAPAGYVREYVTHNANRKFTDSPLASLNLTIRETPEYWSSNVSDWAKVTSYGATPNDSTDDTAGIRAAIASGKPMIFFPEGQYRISDTIDVGGAVRKMFGANTIFAIHSTGVLASATPANILPVFRIVTAAHSNPIIIENLSPRLALNPTGTIQFEHASQNPFVLADVQLSTFTPNILRTASPASGVIGDLFLEDVGSGGSNDVWQFNVAGQRIFARQFDVEGTGGVANAGAQLWILGLKTEGRQTVVTTTNGGQTEVLGGLLFPTDVVNDDAVPAFKSTDSQISLTALGNDGYSSTNLYNILVQDIRGADVRNYRRNESINQFFRRIPMYTGYKHSGNGLQAVYYNNSDFTGIAVTRTDATVNFSFGTGSPDPSIGSDTFSGRWTGQVQAMETGNYAFKTQSDDAVRLYLNGQLIINAWTPHAFRTDTSAAIALVAGEKYDLKLEFFENTASATIRLQWVRPGVGTTDTIPQSQLYTTHNALKGTYRFNDTLAGNEPGSSTLAAVNPLNSNVFETQTVFGSPRRVYRWDGNTTENAGLTLDTTGTITFGDTYSLELVFKLAAGPGSWRRVINASSPDSDDGLYLDPANHLFVVGPGGNAGGTAINSNEWHHLVFTNNSGFCKAYVDGVVQFGLPLTAMNLTDPGELLRLFVDDSTEYSDGWIALLRLYNSPLSAGEVADRADDPFTLAPAASPYWLSPAPSGPWALNGSGDWNVSAHWAGGIPNAAGATASFGTIITSAQSVFTNLPVTVGEIHFDNPNTYVIGGAGNLTLQTVSGTGIIDVQQGSQKINLPLTFASDTNITVAGGSTLTIGNPTTINANRAVNVSGNLLIQAPLTIETGGSLVIGPGQAVTLSGAPSLVGTGKMDLNAGSAVVEYAGQANPLAAIQAQVAAGFAGGAWTANGITSSAAASVTASASFNKTGVGFADNASLGYTSFGDLAVNPKSILVRYTYYGDANLDGTVDSLDFTRFTTGYGISDGAGWLQGDFDYDGKVNTLDYNLLAGNFGLHLPSTPLSSGRPDTATRVPSVAFYSLPQPDLRQGSSQTGQPPSAWNWAIEVEGPFSSVSI